MSDDQAASPEPIPYRVQLNPQLSLGIDQSGSLVLELAQGEVHRVTVSSGAALTAAVGTCQTYASVMFPPAGPGRPDVEAAKLRAAGWEPIALHPAVQEFCEHCGSEAEYVRPLDSDQLWLEVCCHYHTRR